MINMILKKIFIILICFFSSISYSSPSEEANCSIEAPPKNSYANSNDGYFYFIYPYHLSSDYSGCQTTWNERGEKQFVIKINNGNPIKFSSYEDKNIIHCYYSNSNLKNNDRCPNAESIKNILKMRELGGSEEAKVPKNRDPR